MKNKLVLLMLFGTFVLNSCVQKAYRRVVVITLDVSKVKEVKWVGIRGEGKPLNWESDYPMQELVKDSLYQAIVETKTGYLFAEIKCTVNGEFELKDQPNRRIVFDTTRDTTYVKYVFDKE